MSIQLRLAQPTPATFRSAHLRYSRSARSSSVQGTAAQLTFVQHSAQLGTGRCVSYGQVSTGQLLLVQLRPVQLRLALLRSGQLRSSQPRLAQPRLAQLRWPQLRSVSPVHDPVRGIGAPSESPGGGRGRPVLNGVGYVDFVVVSTWSSVVLGFSAVSHRIGDPCFRGASRFSG